MKLFAKMFKKKKNEKVTVTKYGKTYEFNTFEKAVAFMLK